MTPARAAAAGVAITGVGVLTALGDRLESNLEALHAGRSAIEPAPELGGAGAARIAGFEATRYVAVPGLRLYSRACTLGICAVGLALADAGLEAAGRGEELGVVTASTFGHLETLVQFDRGVVTAGFQRTNPALMPLAIPSAPGAVIALSFGARAFSVTLADSGVSSLDALGLGARLVAGGRARVCVVVGAFDPVDELALSAARAGLLAPARSFLVLDRRRRGTALGEAAAALVLERAEDARARGVEPRGFVRGQASTFASEPAAAPPAQGRPPAEAGPRRARARAPISRALGRACAGALRAAGLRPSDLALVSAGANGSVEGDRAEAEALLDVLGEAAPRTPLVAVKAGLGETVDAAGLLQAAVALFALRAGRAPPIARLEEPEVPGLCYATRPVDVAAGHALVTSTSQTGACSALVVSVS